MIRNKGKYRRRLKTNDDEIFGYSDCPSTRSYDLLLFGHRSCRGLVVPQVCIVVSPQDLYRRILRSSAFPVLSATETLTASVVVKSILFNDVSCGYDVFIFIEHPGVCFNLYRFPL
jgi:hypothetical protein